MGYWPNDWDDTSCHSCGCIKPGVICAPRGDDIDVVVSVLDTDGDEFDISGSSEIVFIVADGEFISGNIYPGGTVHITKRLTTGGIVLAGSGFEFVTRIRSSDTSGLPRVNLYYEIRVTTSAGLHKTVSAGIFKTDNTMIKDLI